MDKLGTMLSAATPVFVYAAEGYLNLVILVALLVIEIVAFINCVTQRSDAFPVVGSLSKAAWLAILGASVLFTLICSYPLGSSMSIFAFIAIIAAGIYMLDVRPALRDATDGTGSW
jgi:hypothetical protein